MFELVYGIFFYILGAILHMVIHRICIRFRCKTFKTVLIFLIIGLFYGYLLFFSNRQYQENELRMTGLILYGLLSIFHIILYSAPFYNAQSPSSVILLLVSSKQRMTGEEIHGYFRRQDMISPRLTDLIAGNLIEKKKGKFTVTPSGSRLIRFINTYRKLLKWHKGG